MSAVEVFLTYSGLYEVTLSATTTLTQTSPSLFRVTPSATGLSLLLPSAASYLAGDNLIIHNTATTDFTVADNAGGTISTATGSSLRAIYVRDNATASGSWAAFVFGNSGGALPGANADITSLTGLTTPLAVADGGSGSNFGSTTGSTRYIYQATSGVAFGRQTTTQIQADLGLGALASCNTWSCT